MLDQYSCGMTPLEVAAEAFEAERETEALKAMRKAEREAYFASLSKHQRHNLKRRPDKCYDESFRRARMKNALPLWLTSEDKSAILEKYRLAVKLEAVTGVPHSVDHIIPLRGVCRKTWLSSGNRVKKHTVCGFHVPDNLRVIPLGINRDIKADWFDSDWLAWPTVEADVELYGFERDDRDEEIPW
ncbi:hypothetical protein [Thioclava sp.]|uniref:hypothetical protein n=1 Tax=Thioclava sp. TaxID=1933450 RepID=UPI003AA87947